MDYTYFIENLANKHVTLDDIYENNQLDFIYILCYHVNNESKYPFLQFMVEKIPFCNNMITEQFILPSCIFTNTSQIPIQELIMQKIHASLTLLDCDTSKLNTNIYKGIFYDDIIGTPYALVDITTIDINYLKLTRDTTIWFALPSEIINTKTICNIPIDPDLTQLFLYTPELGILHNPKTENQYIIPDAVYNGGEYKNVEFNSIFGQSKRKICETCGEYYFFYRTFNHSIQNGGWNNNTTNTNNNGRLLVDNEFGRYIKGGINRYALFTESPKIYFEFNDKLTITDKMINDEYDQPCILIFYKNENENKEDIIVKDYESFFPLSYHGLNKKMLGEIYDKQNNEYIIN